MNLQLQSVTIHKAIALRDSLEVKFLQLGKYLSEIERKELWRGEYSSFHEFVEMGMKMSPATCSKLIKVYETYILAFNLSPVKLSRAGYSNLYTAIPLLKDGNVEEVVEKAVTLGRRGIEIAAKDFKYGEHDCEPDLNVCLRPCRNCGRIIRV